MHYIYEEVLQVTDQDSNLEQAHLQHRQPDVGRRKSMHIFNILAGHGVCMQAC